MPVPPLAARPCSAELPGRRRLALMRPVGLAWRRATGSELRALLASQTERWLRMSAPPFVARPCSVESPGWRRLALMKPEGPRWQRATDSERRVRPEWPRPAMGPGWRPAAGSESQMLVVLALSPQPERLLWRQARVGQSSRLPWRPSRLCDPTPRRDRERLRNPS